MSKQRIAQALCPLMGLSALGCVTLNAPLVETPGYREPCGNAVETTMPRGPRITLNEIEPITTVTGNVSRIPPVENVAPERVPQLSPPDDGNTPPVPTFPMRGPSL